MLLSSPLKNNYHNHLYSSPPSCFLAHFILTNSSKFLSYITTIIIIIIIMLLFSPLKIIIIIIIIIMLLFSPLKIIIIIIIIIMLLFSPLKNNYHNHLYSSPPKLLSGPLYPHQLKQIFIFYHYIPPLFISFKKHLKSIFTNNHLYPHP